MNLAHSTLNHTPYDWTTNYSGMPSSISAINYDGNYRPRLQATTVDTFISSFTHQLHLSESLPTHSTFTPSAAQFFESCISNSSLQWMANYRAINHYYNLRKASIPLTQRTSYIDPSSLLSLNQLSQIKYMLPQNNPIQMLAPMQESSANVFENSIRNVQRLQQKISTLYPPWKHFNMRRAVTPNFEQMASKFNIPQTTNPNIQSDDLKWNNSNETPVNTIKKQEKSNFEGTNPHENSKCDKNVNPILENSNSSPKLCSCHIKPSLKNNFLVEYLYKYYNYINPYCEVCAVSFRRKNNHLMEINEQKMLLHFLKLNSHELTDGIKVILTWPLEKISNNLSVIDGLTSFYEDENKKKIKELFSDKNERNIGKVQANDLRIIYQTQPLLNNLAAINYERLERSNALIFEDMLKYPEANNYGLLKSKIHRVQNEEQVRNRMAEFVCIGPLNNNWYMELLNGFWVRDRPRMNYTRSFLNTDLISGDLIKAKRP